MWLWNCVGADLEEVGGDEGGGVGFDGCVEEGGPGGFFGEDAEI